VDKERIVVEKMTKVDMAVQPFVRLSPFRTRSITDVRNWVMCEKFNGIRAALFRNELITRNGLKIDCPAWYISTLPDSSTVPIDGELFMGHDRFEDLLRIINRPKNYTHNIWHSIWFVAFDLQLPDVEFADRVKRLRALRVNGKSYFRVVEYVPVASIQHINEFLDQIVNRGGEGLVLRELHALYSDRRSSDAMKLKKMQRTMARVVNVSKTNLSGATIVTVEHDGSSGPVTSRVTLQRGLRIPKINDAVEVKHYGHTRANGTLKFATISL